MTRVGKFLILQDIARRQMGVPQLTARKRDCLDFYDCAVWRIQAALEEAFDAGTGWAAKGWRS
jgi:hypothetical protein